MIDESITLNMDRNPDDDEYSIRWKGFRINMMESLENLQNREDFADVSVSCDEGHSVQGHKLILASCSPYFRKILKDNPCPHPVLILNDVPLDILQAIMTYMYHGSVSVVEKKVPLFLKVARHLQIKGIGEAQEDAANNLSMLASAAVAAGNHVVDNPVHNRRKAAPPRRLQEYRVPKYVPPSNNNNNNNNNHLLMDLKPVFEPPPPPSSASAAPPPPLPPPRAHLRQDSDDGQTSYMLHIPPTLLTIPDPNVLIKHEEEVITTTTTTSSSSLTTSSIPMSTTALDMSIKIPSPPPEDTVTRTVKNHQEVEEEVEEEEEEVVEEEDVKKETSDESEMEVLMPLTSATTSEQMAALLGPSWKSRQPRMCPYCKRMFSNKFNLKQHILNMHTVGRELQCEQCQKKVKNKWYLRRHHVTHHGAPLKK